MTTNRVLKVTTNKSYSGWDWTYDGAFPEPRVKGKNKRQRSKLQRNLQKRFTRKEMNENLPL